MKVCSIPGCERVHVARGWCDAHWTRWRKYGDPLGGVGRGRHVKPPLYVLPHGIEVIGEYAPTAKNPYWRVRIRPHPFFEGTALQCGGHLVRRNRAVLASKLGRTLTAQEHAHHGGDGPHADTPDNLEVLSPAEHNSHHKTGSRHTAEAKARIGAALKRAYTEGRHVRLPITNRDHLGRIAA